MKISLTFPEEDSPVEIDLKNRGLAALMTWIIPGAGQMYQGRTAKGILFMSTILVIFLAGMFIGGGRVVYACWKGEQMRLYYLCQVGVGLSLPALLQDYLVSNDQQPISVFGYALMAPPKPVPDGVVNTELSEWHKKLGLRFELGTTYTVVAGLLNFLAIYDAWAGPFIILPKKRKKEDEEEEKKKEASPDDKKSDGQSEAEQKNSEAAK